ncbi:MULTISPECIES: hypothetical protein [Bacteroidaceae]|uniref:Uncharacterized protein n=1 Tax=Phocaeicola faecium TaxID=2762213 RepID=A0ABR8V8D2_9BACT|nr:MULTISPECIES: hypothetical protein [Bacteroidaceae]MBD8000926.1 hypothetical protein [Phocaeicola faecium]
MATYPTLLFLTNRGKNKNSQKPSRRRYCENKRLPLFHYPALHWHQSVLAVASGRVDWHGAVAFSCEVCRGITACGRQHPDVLATVRQTVVLAARRLAASLF